MPQVCSWSDVLLRYGEMDKLPNVSSSATYQEQIIDLAEAAVNARLSSQYTTPFSNNNLTAKDLVIDMVYVQNNLTRQPEKTKLLNEYLDTRFTALLNGGAGMITSSGGVAMVAVGDTVWSSTENYPPTFGMSDIEHAIVSSEQLYDEAALRGEYR
jgi:hypothetical protein